MKFFIAPAVKSKAFALTAHLLGKQKHRFMTRAFTNVTVGNVTYLRNAASQVFCMRCGEQLNLIGRELADLTFDEMYGCTDHPIDPTDPKERETNGYELRPAS
jgi:hypothetical protein